jgi:pimeloyl-ACP methyl ester carboxylesterase
VVLGPGLGASWFDWTRVLTLTEPFARTTVYERPIGTALPAPPSLAREVAVLTSVVERTGAPAVLAGHSIAAVHVEAFARRRPELVRGVVLVDPDAEVIGAGKPFDLGSVLANRMLRAYRVPLVRATAALGVRWSGTSLRRLAIRASTLAHADPAPSDLVREVYSRPAVAEAALAELAGYADQVAELDAMRATSPLPRVPWTVLTAEHSATSRTVARHRALAALVPGGRQEIVPGSRHMMPIDRPDAIARVIRETLEGLTSV